MESAFPFFSIIIPTYNRAHILPKAIDSVLTQSFHDFEIIVVDDGSTDETKQMIERFDSKKIKYNHQFNAGVCMARNNGAKLAFGEYLIFLDSDDWLLKDTLQMFYDSTQIKPLTNLVMGTINWFDSNDKRIRTVNPFYGNNRLAQGLTGSFAIRSELFQQIGEYDFNLTYSENSDLFLRLNNSNFVTRENVALVNSGGVAIREEDTASRLHRYSKKKYDSVKYFLEKHQLFFETSKKDFINFKRIHAITALQNDKFEEAANCLLEIINKVPFSLKSRIHYYFIWLFPGIAKKYYDR